MQHNEKEYEYYILQPCSKLRMLDPWSCSQPDVVGNKGPGERGMQELFNGFRFQTMALNSGAVQVPRFSMFVLQQITPDGFTINVFANSAASLSKMIIKSSWKMLS